MLSRLLKISYHFAVYAVGICVLLAAVGVTIIRLLLPDIGMYRNDVEAWVGRYMGYPVVIHSLQASWEGWTPNLYLKNIDLLNKEGTGVITHFNSAQISINPVATLLERRFVPRHLLISGFDLTVTRHPDGSLSIQGFRLTQTRQRRNHGNELAEWLFSQNRVEIQQAGLEWIDLQHQKQPEMLNKVHLLLRTDGDRTQISGSAELPPAFGNSINFALDARGNLLTSAWSGEMYMEGDKINPDNWYKEYRPPDLDIAGGSADVKVWSTWKNAKPTGLQGLLEYRDFDLRAGSSSLHVDNLACRLKGEIRNNRDWRIGVQLEDFRTAHGPWPKGRFVVTAQQAPENGRLYTARFSYLRLDDLMPLLGDIPALSAPAVRTISGLHLRGELTDGKLIYNTDADPARRLLYDIHFGKLSSTAKGKIPAIRDLSGRTYGDLAGGTVAFSGDSAQLMAPELKVERLPLDEIDGKLSWHREPSGWRLHTPLLTLSNPKTTVRLAGTARLHKGAPPYLDAEVELAKTDLEALTGYIPYTSKFKMRDWMEKAVLGGNLDSATVLIRGSLADFPFRDAQGQFRMIASVENGVLEYSPHWPVVDNISAEITGDRMQLSARFNGGQVYNASFKDGTVTIPDIFVKEKHILVNGRMAGDTDDLKLFLMHSPLDRDVTLTALDKALSGGDFNLHLNLDIPFHIPGKKPVIGGTFNLNGFGLVSDRMKMKLDDISGKVSFTAESVSAKNLSARFNGLPVSVDAQGAKQVDKDASSTTINIHGSADKTFIADQIDRYLPRLPIDRRLILDNLSGKTGWNASLKFDRPPGSKTLQRSFTVSSDLQGLAVGLPAPLKKTANEKVAAEFSRQLETHAPSAVKLAYGNRMNGEIILPPAGAGSAGPGASRAGGIRISGNIKELPVTQWWDVLAAHGKTAEQPSPLPGGINADLDADLDIGDLTLLSQRFNDVRVNVGKEKDGWHIIAAGKDVAGNMILPQPMDRNALVTINLDRLALRKIDKKKHARLDPASIPSIRAHVKQFSYDGKELGDLTMESSPITNGLAFDTITFNKPGLSIRGQGVWKNTDSGAKSSFTIETHAKKIDTMLKTFGYDVNPIKNGETNLLINADWQGSPMEFSLPKLNGHISMHIKEGQLLNVDPSAGRLFGLLSIQTLPRRLTLDFSDLFGKGLAFDRIQGNFDITNGDAYTNDLFMKGPSVEIAVSGRTGLSEKDYDQVVTVTPRISGSLPVAGALFGPVGIGVGTAFFLAGKMFSSLRENIDSLLRYQYTITGSWNNPVIKKIKPANEAKS